MLRPTAIIVKTRMITTDLPETAEVFEDERVGEREDEHEHEGDEPADGRRDRVPRLADRAEAAAGARMALALRLLAARLAHARSGVCSPSRP
jgi:hypothetical protein